MKTTQSIGLAAALAAVALPALVNAQGSLLEDIKKGATSAAQTVGQAADKAANQVNETIENTRKSLRDEDTPARTRAKLDAMSQATLERLFADKPATRDLFAASYGYAVFDTRQVSIMVAGAYGRGVAVNRETDRRTYMKTGSAGVGVGFGIGGFDTQVVIFFENAFVFNNFVTQGWDGSAQAGAMAGEDKENLRIGFDQGQATYVLTKNGWQIAAKLLGTKYWPDAALNDSMTNPADGG